MALGPEYSGYKVSRQALDDSEEDDYEDSSRQEKGGAKKFADPEDVDLDDADEDGEIDSDEALGDSNEEKFRSFAFRGSGKPRTPNGHTSRPTAADFMSDSEHDEGEDGIALDGNDADGIDSEEDLLDVSEQHQNISDDDDEQQNGDSEDEESIVSEGEGSRSSEEDSEDESGDERGDGSTEKARRAELRKIMGEEQKTVVATISQAAKADAAKGNAVKQQRKAFDSLLGVRMVLQKALIATNSFAAVDEKEIDEPTTKPYQAAEEAAVKLWNTLDSIRQELSKAISGSKTGQKRKRGIEMSTSSASIWERMQKSEVAIIDHRQQTLEKWSAKVRGATALPLSRKLNPTASQQSITSMLQDQLASSDHLVKKTKMPRSCAPVQRDLKLVEDPNIYDDGNFYQMLLKELVDQRRVESLSAPAAGEKMMQWVAVKEAKTRKHVDTKASKGRKMRFTVHEKLQNFMAPEDRGSWEPEAIDRFFGTLLGQKMTLRENDESGDEEEGSTNEEECLTLFRS